MMRRARIATFAFFGLNGFVLGMWVVHIPVIEQRAGLDHATFGLLLLLLGGGAFAGMQVAGPLTDRFGPHRVVPLSAVLCTTALILPGLATNGFALGAALLALGLGNGCLDVSMNAHAVEVEHAYGRTIMSAFHAVWSVGGFLAALVGARTLTWGWSPVTTFAVATGSTLLIAAAATPALLRKVPKPAEERQKQRKRTPSRIWWLAVIAFLLMLAEGVANDWSVLHLSTVLGAPEATAAFAYGCFAAAMTIGRLLTDPVAQRFGPVAIVRYGSVIATAGILTASLTTSIPVALVGWTLFGIGLSGAVPQLFSAAGHADRDNAGANVSRVAGLGYLGILAGPAVVGPMTHLMPLNYTFLLIAVFCVVAVATAGLLSPATPASASPGTRPSPPEHQEAGTRRP
ncbi:putative MFS family arabinose efflux permease [Actinophytocola algeriensis]|uniref:Putative MFS family arabinose efflux permease n=2 Tax=Actinophytocola algeriensis TaxID=1768010 RepID=A0A7W7Q6N7_9PSEU|nr:putative MFS family arabinose efflux permease [Actinophytocola algeriensis]MBE1480075.1 putative MFS family arabinose efflux permease [Actinophytocola algeriensis]